MLSAYIKTHKETLNQLILLKLDGTVVDNGSIIFDSINGRIISEIHPFFESLMPSLVKKDQNIDFVCVNLDLQERLYIVDLTLKTFKNEDHAIIIIHDLTKQYEKYQPVAQLRNESKIRSEILAFQNELLIQKENFKNNFIANLSHEIKMPLNTINGYSFLLENTNLSQSQRYNLNVIKSTNERLENMINDILDISKIETGHLHILPNRFNLFQELQTLSHIYKEKCESKGLEYYYVMDKNCPQFVIGGKFRLIQILSNILENAFKFTNSGNITLQVNCLKQNPANLSLEFVISDTGIGIEPAKLDSIFNSFYQINNALINQGTGLGLAIVKKLVHTLEGEISVTSKVDEGTVFKVQLDFEIPKNQALDTETLHILNQAKNYEYRILVAEPLKKDQTQLLEILKEEKKYEIVIVENGDAVIKQLYKNNFDLVILNLTLPKMNGLDTARFIRQSEFPEMSNLPIIAVTYQPSEKEESLCQEMKTNGYLSKPYNKENLLKTISKTIQKKASFI